MPEMLKRLESPKLVHSRDELAERFRSLAIPT